MRESRVWLITGTSTGLGRALVDAVAASGDQVVATARRPQDLDGLVARHPEQVRATRLDVTQRAAIGPLVTEVLARYGRIDVLVNNAGRGHFDAAEQVPDTDLRDLFELNVFGPAALVRAVLPGMRARRSGWIVQMSSVEAHIAFPGLSAYCSTKAALEGFSETLAVEVAPLGIRVLIVEPGNFRTEFLGPGLKEGTPLPDYQDTVGMVQTMMKTVAGHQPGDPSRAAQAILTAMAAEEVPLRLPLGPDCVDLLRAKLAAQSAEISTWEALARSTNFADVTDPAG
jgi:NAD(P)-dependent dehydrogenase (short-subunit alcohol dehydrogenase family)